MDLQPCQLIDLIKSVNTFFNEECETKRVRIALRVDPRLAETYYLDERKTAQVAMGLISNAMNFSDDGLVEVRLQLLERLRPTFGDTVVMDRIGLSIKDHGHDVPDALVESLFDSENACNKLLHGEEGAADLGLKLVKQNISDMDASFSITRDSQSGHEFRVTFIAEVYEAELVF